MTYAITKYNKTIREESNNKVEDVSDDEEVESLPKPTPTPAPELNNLKDILGWGDGGKAAEEHKVMLSQFLLRPCVLFSLSLIFPIPFQ